MSVDWRDCVLGGHGVTVRGWRAEPASSHGGMRSGTFTHLFLGLVTGRAGFRGRGPGLSAELGFSPGPAGAGRGGGRDGARPREAKLLCGCVRLPPGCSLLLEKLTERERSWVCFCDS